MSTKSSAKHELLSRGLAPKKSFGQNFMIDQQVNEVFAQSVRSFGDELTLVEIGAGTGSLTNHLLKHASLVHAIERDRDLVPILANTYKEQIASGKLFLHEADGVKFDLSSVLNKNNPGVLVGNLPYHLTSSIIFLTLRNRSYLKGAVFMVQKEVAYRLAAGPHNKQYGFLTVILNLAFSIELVLVVNKDAFWPAPKIDSAIIKLETKDNGISQIDDLEAFIIFTREIFQQRRKKLSTILKKTMSSTDIESSGIDASLRPENLEPRDFLTLFKKKLS